MQACPSEIGLIRAATGMVWAYGRLVGLNNGVGAATLCGMAGKTFRHTHTVRFGEIDYAGIVYYPNFFDYYQQVEEEFMGHLGYHYHHMLGELKQGFPIVHVDADFKHPIRYGDTIEIAMRVAKLGKTSVTFRFEVYKQFEHTLCAHADIHHALIDTKLFKPIAIPSDMRAALSAYLVASGGC